MISKVLDKVSFWALFIVVVLLPIFFLPFSKIPIETSKTFLLVIGLAVSIIFWIAARFSDGKISFPKSWLVLSGFGIVLAFFISAILSGAPHQVSFFGTMFDVGTFWFMFAAFLLMLASAVILKDQHNAKKVFFGLIASFTVLFIFQVLYFLMPNTMSFGLLTTKTSNIFGSWSALGIFAGLIAAMSLFAIEFFALSKSLRRILKISILLSVFLAIAVNSALVWKILGVFSLIIFIYKISFSFGRHTAEGEERTVRFPVISLAIVMVSLLFFMAGQFIGGVLPSRLGLSNIEVGPSFSATMEVAKATLTKDPVLGIGPNRFGEAWATSKPAVINSTQFWDVSFDSGSGVLPTFATTTGIVGIITLLVFFVLFILYGLRAIFSSIKNGLDSGMVAFFVGALYLFVAAFFYSTGPVLLLLAFAFTGIFIGLYNSGIKNGEASVTFFGNPKKSFVSVSFLVIMMILVAALGFKFTERFASVYYFGKALGAETIEVAESSINKAISLYQNDLYLRTYTQVYLIKLNNLASKGASLSDAEKADLQVSFDRAVEGAQQATISNGNNYLNFRVLGSVYETVGAYGVTGAYEKAVEAYNQASVLSPQNPGLKLSLARISFVEGKLKQAREYANEALSLKQNYIDALVILSQISKSEGNTSSAISYAEQALALSPTNNDLIQYLNSLKGTSSPSVPAPTSN